MRTRTVLFWAVLAGLLAVVVALTRSPGVRPDAHPSGPATWTLPIDPARVVLLKKIAPGRPDETARRAANAADRWTLEWPAPGGTARRWPADDARVRAALRLLSTTEITLGDEDPDLETVATLRVVEGDNRAIEVAFAPRSAGGLTPVVVSVLNADGFADKRVYGRIGSGVPDAFVRTDWSAWRDPTLFEPAAATTRALSVSNAVASVRLERGARGWAIAAPFVLDADPRQVDRLLNAIAGLQASGFEDNPPQDSVTGLDKPGATIRVETDSGTRELLIGKPTSGDGQSFYARIWNPDSPASLDAIVRLSFADPNALNPNPDYYARLTPLPVSPADVAQVRFVGADGRPRLESRRSAGDWTIAGAKATPDQRDAIDRLVRVLTTDPAAKVRWQDVPADTRGELGIVECLTPEGLPIARLTVRVEDGLNLVVARPAGEGRELVWTATSETAKGVALWASALANRG